MLDIKGRWLLNGSLAVSLSCSPRSFVRDLINTLNLPAAVSVPSDAQRDMLGVLSSFENGGPTAQFKPKNFLDLRPGVNIYGCL